MSDLQALASAKTSRALAQMDARHPYQHQTYTNPYARVPDAFSYGVYESPGQTAGLFDLASNYTLPGMVTDYLSPTETTLQGLADQATNVKGLGYDPTNETGLESAARWFGQLVGDPFNALGVPRVAGHTLQALARNNQFAEGLVNKAISPYRKGMIGYHGTDREIIGDFDPGSYITPNPEYASRHARSEGGNVHKLNLDETGILDTRTDAGRKKWDEYAAYQNKNIPDPHYYKKLQASGLPDHIEEERFTSWLIDRGDDLPTAVMVDENNGQIAARVYEPNNLKNVFGSNDATILERNGEPVPEIMPTDARYLTSDYIEPPHQAWDRDKTAGMIRAMRRGEEMPPILVNDGQAYSGSHRLDAWARMGKKPSVIDFTSDEYKRIMESMNLDPVYDVVNDFEPFLQEALWLGIGTGAK